MNKQFNRFIAPTRPDKVYDSSDLTIIILSAAIPYGMKTYGPKSLLPVIGGSHLLKKQLDTVRHIYPKATIITVVGYEADKIIKTKPECLLVENQLYEDTGEIEQLRLALNLVKSKNVLIINGDSYFNEYAINFDVTKNISYLLVSNQSKNKSEIGVSLVNNKATQLVFSKTDYKWCNICFISNKIYNKMYSYVNNRENNRQYLFQMINHLLDKDVELEPYINDKAKSIKIDKSEDIRELLKI